MQYSQISCGALATILIASFSLAGGPAVAQGSDPRLSGWSESTFVAAATSEGVPEHIARGAWGDQESMASIPVESGVKQAGSSESEKLSQLGPTKDYWAWCERWSKHALGNVIVQYRIRIDYTASYGSIIWAKTKNEIVQGSWGWCFVGTVDSSDDYISAPGYPTPAHDSGYQSYRMVNFGHDVPAHMEGNVWVDLMVDQAGDAVCEHGSSWPL
ncbi:hypothetical protein [Plantibacter sp. YIM 135249]|uniref:hypothetical protein n=1 Tax=Plantibacter sp. YIM 135249 TaxID=3423918 RepID=UPI003D3502E6